MKQLLKSEFFYNKSKPLAACLLLWSVVFLCYGIMSGLLLAPIDYQQQDAVRIMYVHVPCAILSLTVYTIIGFASVAFLIWKVKLFDIIAAVSASFGAAITAVALISGALWGKPMWGTWWVWDARLTSELILLFLYFGYIGLRAALDLQIAARASAILAVVGLIDIPVIHFSVTWWHTLHQGASLTSFAKPTIAAGMLWPLLAVLIGLYLFYFAMLLLAARGELLWRERNTRWVRNIFQGGLLHVE